MKELMTFERGETQGRATGEAHPMVFADAAEVARLLNPERPVHCFSADALTRQLRAFLRGFPGEVSYAVKANSTPEVIKTLGDAGLKLYDVASVEEMELVGSLVPGAHFHYHNPIKSRSEIVRAYREHDVRRFAVDDAGEIAKIAECIPTTAGVEIAVRFRLPKAGASAHDFSTKFGATPDEAAVLLADVVARGFTPVLTFHPGSQCTDPAAYARHIRVAAEIAGKAGVEIAALNVGGGFPAQYVGDDVPLLRTMFQAIKLAARSAFGAKSTPRLECEPGRGLVAGSTSLLTRVKAVKPHRSEIFLNDGIYGALMEVSQCKALQPPHRALRGGKTLTGANEAFTVYGPTCDPLDVLPSQLDFPATLREDDFVEFGMNGAYGRATATRFNGYEAAAVVPVRKVFTGRR